MPSLVLVIGLLVTNLQDPRDAGRAMIAALQARDFARIEAQFDDRMKTALPPGRLATAWDSLLRQAGALKSCAADARIRAIADKQMVITACEFERATIDVQFAFDAAGRISGLTFRPAAAPEVPYSPPAYAEPSRYAESDVTIGAGEWALPGTLTLPAGAGPFPAVVLVQGSGPNDRDETVGANKPFKDLALGLGSRGVAVLRYDKRTKVYPAKMAALAGMTVKEEVVDDALAALAMLRANPRIDPSRVFVLGHSLGGMLIPRIAAADPKLAGAIVMAGAARPLQQAIVEQTKYLAAADGTITPEEQAGIDDAVKLAQAIDAVKPEDPNRMVAGAPPSYWLDLRGYDPPAAARNAKTRLLVLQGERDYQVTMDEFARWKAALAGRTDVTFHSYPALNHLFLAGSGKSVPAEYNRPSHVAEDVISDIAVWITRK